MKKLNTAVIVFMMCLLAASSVYSDGSVSSAEKWKYSFYQSVSYKNFRKLDIFNRKIDFRNIDYPLLNAAVFYAANEQRVRLSKKPLDFALQLEIAAWEHSRRMEKYNFFSHRDNTSSSRRNPGDRGRLAGISNPKVAENIAYRYIQNGYTYLKVADEFIKGWMKSPGHRRNILSSRAFQMGCGIYIGKPWSSNRSFIKVLGTQNFQWFYKITSGTASDKGPCPEGCR